MDVGVQINQYKIVEHIGRGGMADVWSARDTRLNRMVAIKTIAHGLSPEVDPVNMFKQEAQTIARMEHPHILPIYDFGEFEGQLYIVMRFVAGGSLEDMLRRGPLPLEEALRMGRAVGEALEYAHVNQVVHLDLKPPNVLLDNRQSPYLADFGLATVMDLEGKATNPGSGTLLYMAPEQMTSDVVDHRADIYSFCIVLFHMLTGQLPFQGAVPLAIRQVQSRGELPAVTDLNAALPTFLNDLLRRGTSIDIARRPASVTAILDEITQLLASSTGYVPVLARLSDREEEDSAGGFQGLTDKSGSPVTDMELLEAHDIYSRARHAWAGGNGRFLLGLTHFMIMNGYYMYAEYHGLDLDEAGTQMLLRGALEFNVEVDYWWNQLDSDNRRWVCLHTVRSGTAPARTRALYRLETLSDSEKPVIPKLVAQALQVESDEAAQLAALQVLGTRFKLMRQDRQYDVLTEYRGRMLTTMTRLGVQLRPQTPQVWQEAVYTPEIDLLIAETALDDRAPKVAELAARIIGRMRSTTSVRYIAEAQKQRRAGALRALALIRDEAPSLPPVVNSAGRGYAWLANSWRRMTDHALAIVWRYLFAMLGGWLALGLHIFVTFRGQVMFEQQRWANAIAMGLVFGVIVGFVAIVGEELPSRLRNFWPLAGRMVMSLALGTLFGAVAWWAWGWLFLGLEPQLITLVFGGLGIGLGYTLTTTFNLRSMPAVLVTAALAYIPIFITYTVGQWYEPFGPFGTVNAPRLIQLNEALLYYTRFGDDLFTPLKSERIFTVAIPFVLLVALGGYFQSVVQDGVVLARSLRPRKKQNKRSTREFAAVPYQTSTFVSVTDTAEDQPLRTVNMATEMDLQREALRLDPDDHSAQVTEEVRGKDVPLPSAREQAEFLAIDAPPATEAVMPGNAATEERPRFRNVSYGKGFKLDIGSMKTELDASRALQDSQGDSDEE